MAVCITGLVAPWLFVVVIPCVTSLHRPWKPKLENVFMNACELLFSGTRHYELTADDYYHLKKRGRSAAGLG